MHELSSDGDQFGGLYVPEWRRNGPGLGARSDGDDAAAEESAFGRFSDLDDAGSNNSQSRERNRGSRDTGLCEGHRRQAELSRPAESTERLQFRPVRPRQHLPRGRDPRCGKRRHAVDADIRPRGDDRRRRFLRERQLPHRLLLLAHAARSVLADLPIEQAGEAKDRVGAFASCIRLK